MKKFILAVAVAAVATMGVASSASAGVERYQMQTMTITALQPENEYKQWTNVWTHTYTVTLNPCDGSFTGTGSVSGTLGGFLSDETISGKFVGDDISFMATRKSDGVKYELNGPISDTLTPIEEALIGKAWYADGTEINVSPNALEFRISGTTTNTSNYKNHGDYVKQAGDKADAAHSCIGMPIH